MPLVLLLLPRVCICARIICCAYRITADTATAETFIKK